LDFDQLALERRNRESIIPGPVDLDFQLPFSRRLDPLLSNPQKFAKPLFLNPEQDIATISALARVSPTGQNQNDIDYLC
jgi:hypothetical protein